MLAANDSSAAMPTHTFLDPGPPSVTTIGAADGYPPEVPPSAGVWLGCCPVLVRSGWVLGSGEPAAVADGPGPSSGESVASAAAAGADTGAVRCVCAPISTHSGPV